MKRKLLLLTIAFILGLNISAQGFLKRDNKRIVDGQGNNVILRGIGPGGWMLQEGYMLKTNEFANPQHQIRAKIESVIGKENTDTFYQAWLTNYMQKVDVDSIKAYGFNSIRLPMHYNLFTLPIEEEPDSTKNTWLEKGFVMTDSLLAWCKANQIYLILDMHATPGGQGKDAAISDYNPAKPSLWQSQANRNKLAALWKKLAERYVNEEWIGAYDLINEINWDFENSGNQNGCNCNQNKPLWDYYKELITTIREVDTNHLIFLEGNCWGNNYNGLGTLASFDNNIALSFHKYWNYNTTDAIQGLLNLRNSTNLPLWCGESGENSNVWYTQAISMLEKNNIGWAWWTYKKFGSTSGTNSVVVTPEYENLLAYWKNGGTKPSVESAKATLMKMADNLKLENCEINTSVIDAMIRQVQSAESKAFAKNNIPGSIFAIDYDYGRVGVAYEDTDTANYHVSTNTYVNWNAGYAFRNDGVDIEACKDSVNKGYSVGWTNPGEWMQYTVDVDSSMAYKLSFRYASNNTSATVHISVDGRNVSGSMVLPSTGGWAVWKTLVFDNLVLTKGNHKIRLHFDQNGCNVNYMKFDYSKNIADVPFEKLSAYTSENGRTIYIELNSALQNSVLDANDFSVLVNNEVRTFTSVSHISDFVIGLQLTNSVVSGQKILLSYNGTSVKDTANKTLNTFSDYAVINNRPQSTNIPAKIQAENYYRQQGLSLEDCKDTGGGKNIAYTNAGDYLDYNILVNEPGSYNIDFRVAALASGGIIELQLLDDGNKTVLGTLNVPATGGWQVYKNVSGQFNIPKGQFVLRVFIQKPEFNINWFEFSTATKISHLPKEVDFSIYPNPASESIKISSKSNFDNVLLTIYSVDGQQLLKENAYPDKEINIQALKNGFYLVKFEKNHKESMNSFIKR